VAQPQGRLVRQREDRRPDHPRHRHEITGPEREQMWRTLNEKVFDYDSYQRKVSRQIAVVALTPTGS
jgi:hypothetical protein